MSKGSVTISNNGMIAAGSDGLSIEYRGVDNCPYGKTATEGKQTFSGIVVHHTAPDHDADWYVQYQIEGDPERGGHFGYHFYIAEDGKIIQGAPLTKRTNHVKPSNSDKRTSFRKTLNNTNAIGISCVGAGMPEFSPTAKQLASVFELTRALCGALDIPHENIVGHGEVQTDRHETEGRDPSKLMREGSFAAANEAMVAANRSLIDDNMDDQPIADRDGGDESEDSNVAASEAVGKSGNNVSVSMNPSIGSSRSTSSTDIGHNANARDGLNVRSGPGTEFPIIRSLPFGTKVNLLRREGRWGFIDEVGDGATDGSVHLAFLDETTSAANAGRELTADQVKDFWSGRNPRGARLYNSSGQALVDPQLLHASAEGIGLFEGGNPNYRVEIYGPGGGFRTSGSVANHGAQPGTGRGAALDFVLIDLTTDRWLTNHPGTNHQYQGTAGQNAPLYQKLFNEVVRAGLRHYDDFDEKARFGGYFLNGNNALDTMHIDMRLHAGSAGGNLRDGFYSTQMIRWGIPANHPYV